MSIEPVTSWVFTPRPIGRFLVDLPGQAVFGQWYQRYQGTGRISVVPEVAPEEFEAIVAKRVDELKSIKHYEGGCQFINDISLDLPNGRAIIYFKNAFYNTDPLKSDDYALKEGFLYKFDCETWHNPVKQKNHIAFLEKMFRAIRPLKPDEIPTEHGFCFEHSILVDRPGPNILEHVIATAVWLDHPDVHITFAALGNGSALDPPLLERIGHSTPFSGTKVLRSGCRELASGEMGEEHLERVKEENGTRGHLFVWEAQGLPNEVYDHPQIRLEMSTGIGRQGPENASLSDEDALKVWDLMVDSIRLRPFTRTTR